LVYSQYLLSLINNEFGGRNTPTGIRRVRSGGIRKAGLDISQRLRQYDVPLINTLF